MEMVKFKALTPNLSAVVFALCLATELLSFLGFKLPTFGAAILLLMTLAALTLALTSPRRLFAVIMAEMVIGTNGRLFSAELSGFSVSLRMALFAAMIVGWMIYAVRGRSLAARFLQEKIAAPFLLLVSALILAAARVSYAGTPLRIVFDDANGYAFMLLIPIGLDLFAGRWDFAWLTRVMIGAASWLWAKCLILLYLFTHDFGPVLTLIFDWQRVTRLAEITRLSGGAVRVFTSSEVFLIPAVFVGVLFAWEYGMRKMTAWTALAAAAFLLSLSRSFWLGAAASSVLMAPILVGMNIVPLNRLGKLAAAGLRILSAAVGIVLLLMLSPVPAKTTASDGWSAYRERLSGSSDAAVSSRWNMLAPLEAGIREHPLLGSGFGASITYRSDDPRVNELHPGGVITTGAIEWQYLEIWLKLGLLGVLSIGWLWWRIGSSFWTTIKTARGADRLWASGLMLSFLAFIVANIFTPYVNHPLGWGFLTFIIVGLHAVREVKREEEALGPVS